MLEMALVPLTSYEKVAKKEGKKRQKEGGNMKAIRMKKFADVFLVKCVCLLGSEEKRTSGH